MVTRTMSISDSLVDRFLFASRFIDIVFFHVFVEMNDSIARAVGPSRKEQQDAVDTVDLAVLFQPHRGRSALDITSLADVCEKVCFVKRQDGTGEMKISGG
ncbi:unnamed protein product [Ilex paraguariensis]|uniref:Uncharacterized protein n=1 Tax=Ilex paraguariensis TaxID=185542 RepID=A0ABC8U7E7_9AQUA